MTQWFQHMFYMLCTGTFSVKLSNSSSFFGCLWREEPKLLCSSIPCFLNSNTFGKEGAKQSFFVPIIATFAIIRTGHQSSQTHIFTSHYIHWIHFIYFLICLKKCTATSEIKWFVKFTTKALLEFISIFCEFYFFVSNLSFH